jgi:hypothetical protein
LIACFSRVSPTFSEVLLGGQSGSNFWWEDCLCHEVLFRRSNKCPEHSAVRSRLVHKHGTVPTLTRFTITSLRRSLAFCPCVCVLYK